MYMYFVLSEILLVFPPTMCRACFIQPNINRASSNTAVVSLLSLLANEYPTFTSSLGKPSLTLLLVNWLVVLLQPVSSPAWHTLNSESYAGDWSHASYMSLGAKI